MPPEWRVRFGIALGGAALEVNLNSGWSNSRNYRCTWEVLREVSPYSIGSSFSHPGKNDKNITQVLVVFYCLS